MTIDHVVAPAQRVGDHGLRLGQVRGAGDVGEHPTGPQGVQPDPQQVPLERSEHGQVGGGEV